MLLLPEDKWQEVRRESLRITNQAMHDQITEAQVEEAHQEAMLDASDDLNERQIALVRSLSRGSVRANYGIDESATEQARLAARQTVEPVTVTIEAGETIVHGGEIVRPEHLEKLEAVGLNDAPVDMRAIRARAGLLVGLTAILVGYLASYRQRRFQEAGPLVLLGLILLVAVGLSKALPIESDLKPVVLPFAAATMLVSVLLGARLAVVMGVVSAFAISVIEGNNFQMAPQLFIAGTVGALAVRRIERTNQVFVAGLAVGLSALATGLLFRSWGGELEGMAALTILTAALINGILSAVIGVKTAPIIGEMFEVRAAPQTAVEPDPFTKTVAPPNAKKPDPGVAIPLPPPASAAGTQDHATAIAREQAAMVSRTSPSSRPIAVNTDPEFEDVSSEYLSALLRIVVGTMVAHADGTVSRVERERLKMHVDRVTELSASERGRLHANLNWMIDVPPDLGLIARRCERLGSKQRRLLGRSALAVAGTDGKINPSEVAVVRKLYRAMGLSDGVFLDDLRELSTGPATAPAAISPPRQHDPGGPVHEPPQSARPPGSVVVLDPKRLAETKADTQQVSIILGEIFAPEDFQEATEGVDSTSDKYEGLDRSYEAMVDELLRRSTWSRRDFDELAKRFNLMADGAVEELNEWAYTRFGEALVEEDMDRLAVNLEIIEEDAG